MLRQITLSLLVVIAGTTASTAADSPLGKSIDGFSLPDFRGKTHALSDYSDQKAVAVAFLGVDCPLARLYAPRLEQLAAEYADRGVTVIAIDSNRQDSVTDLAGFAQRHKLTFPVLKDPNNTVADLFGASRTPEVFLLDSEGVVRYHGRVDDQYGQHVAENNQRISYQHTHPKRRDLAVAIDEMLNGKDISVASTDITGCLIGRVPSVEPSGDVTYSNQIVRILNKRCVECHREGEIAPFALTEYDEVAGWSDMIAEVVAEERMPPWHASPEFGEFDNDCRLSDDEKNLVYTWVENGAPEGDPKDLPEPPKFVSGWQIDEPDQVIHMSDEPFTVAAEGTVEYQYFEVDPGWEEDKWIVAAEARPDNRAVVHHIIAFIKTPMGDIGRLQEEGLGIAYAPGAPPRTLGEGVALYAPAGSKILFQMHYTPNGTEQVDRSYIGVKFAKPEDVKFMAKGGAAMQTRFKIPAGASDHVVHSTHTFKEDELLVSMGPHMHLRGKSFRYVANYPNGESEVLLDVPRYDFNWQRRYELTEPKLMPAGTVLECVGVFDNSADNLSNPDPSIDVTWGDQTWEEMMVGFFSTRDVKELDWDALNAQKEADAKKLAQMRMMAKGFIAGIDADKNGKLSKEEAPANMRGFFDRFDSDGDGEISTDEAVEVIKLQQRGGGRGRGGRRPGQ